MTHTAPQPSSEKTEGRHGRPRWSARDRGLQEHPVRIAILGVGYAGTTAAISLSQVPGLHVELFDAASELREIGASIGIQPCALRCLEKLGLGQEVDALAYRHGEYPLIHRHWRTGTVYPTPPQASRPEHLQMARFARAHLHKLLVKHAEEKAGPVRLLKRVAAVKSSVEGVRVRFEDGTEWSGDMVIGSDGIRSPTRASFYPDYKIGRGVSVTLRGVFPTSVLEDAGIQLPPEPCHWPGPDRSLFTSPLKPGLFTLVAFVPTRLIPGADIVGWGAATEVTDLASVFKGWYPPLAKLCAVAPPLKIYPDWNGPTLPSLTVGGRVALLGDAGHCHGGAFAAGGTLAIEDGYTLGLCVDEVAQRAALEGRPMEGNDIATALSLFDKCRLRHVNRLVAAAHSLRDRRAQKDNHVASEAEINAYVTTHADVAWLADNDAEAVFDQVVANELLAKAVDESLGRDTGTAEV